MLSGSPVKNICLYLEYDGTLYSGWQRQDPLPTIQAYVEDCLQRVEKKRVIIYGAGRTDAGVHARGQVANFFSENPKVDPEKWALLLNNYLPPDIRVQKSFAVDVSFHAQKNAKSKIYAYYVLNAPFDSALLKRVYFTPLKTDWGKVERAFGEFLGTRDFLAFQSGHNERRNTERTLLDLKLTVQSRPHLYAIQLEGNGFLKHMVRNIVGALLAVGQGQIDITDIPKIFSTRPVRRPFRTLPARGLHLVQVNYDAF